MGSLHQVHCAATRLRRQLPYLPKAFRLVRRAAGGLALVWLALLVAQALLPVATVYLTRALVDGLAGLVAMGGGWAAAMPLVPAALGMGLVLMGSEVLQGISKWVRTAQAERVQDHVHELIHRQAMRLDMSFYDDPDYYDQLHRARIDALSRPAALIENAGSLLQSLLTLAAMAGVLLTFGIWVPLLLAVSTLPALWVVLRHTLRFHRWRMENTTAMRKANYFDLLLTQREAAAEMRLFGLGPFFRERFQTVRTRLRTGRVALARSEALAHTAAAMVGLASMAGALTWLGGQVLRGRAGLGDMALFGQAFFLGQRMLRSLLGSTGEFYRNCMFLENLFDFLALIPRVADASGPGEPLPPNLSRPVQPSHPLRQGLCFEKVTFCYPGSERPALDNFSLHVPAGKITAIVGGNGAGKTTLIRLLCRFYDPRSGRVLLDGQDLRDIPVEDLRQRITVLFQDLVRFHDTAGLNIALGDIAAVQDRERIEAAARAGGADGPINRLPHGYDSVLGKWFGGAELSGGEWQRLALARAFYRAADLVVLDEPTSAMDSWAEADWLARFGRLVAGRTALIITHRFTTALKADMIHVMDRGRIIESGSHAELLAAGGRYAASWARQTRHDPPCHALPSTVQPLPKWSEHQ
jgi:ATP-binding cassette, subfamily B, bacterial